MSKVPFEKFEVVNEGRTNRGDERMFQVRVALGETYPSEEETRLFIEQAIQAAIDSLCAHGKIGGQFCPDCARENNDE